MLGSIHHRPSSLITKIIVLNLAILFAAPQIVLANPASDNYHLNDYSFGAGGTQHGISSQNFNLHGLSGDGSEQGSSDNYGLGGGLVLSMQSQVPVAPSLTNPHNYYDRLIVRLDDSSNDPATVYAIAISQDDFFTTQYIAQTGQLKNQLDPQDFHSYQDWGGQDGLMVSGLDSDTLYKIKVKGRTGDFTESDYSPEAQAQTDLPNLIFTIDGSANMGIWNENNNYSSTAISKLITSTNAYNGYSIYAYATTPLTKFGSTDTIANYAGSYANPGSWLTGLGFGYTANDTLVAGQTRWNPTTCPADDGPPLCYAAFSNSAPGDIVVDHQDDLADGPIINQEFELTYKVVTQASQTAGTYRSTIIYTIVPTF